MNDEFGYRIDSLGVHLEYEDKKNVVYEIRAYMTHTEPNGDKFERLFVVNIPVKITDNFIEFDKLTKDDVMKWLFESYSSENLNHVKKQLIEQYKPKKAYLLPNFK